MSLRLRAADLEADRNAIVSLLARHLNPAYDHRRFDWVYRDNPVGPGRAWVAAEVRSGAIVAVAGASARTVYVAGNVEVAWALTDFCVAPEYRALGPAVALQRACLEAAVLEKIAFCYDFPAMGMLPVYQRLGMTPAFSMRRAVKFLRADGRVRQVIRNPALAAPAIAGANLVLRALDGLRHRGREARLHPIEDRCGEEFTALAERMKGAWQVCLRRSAEYLNWRYLDVPFQRYEIVAAREAGALTGYGVLAQQGDRALLVDLLCGPTAADFRSLLHGILSLVRGRGLAAVATFGIEPHPWLPLLSRLGFSLRESTPVIVHGGAALDAAAPEQQDWLLTHGDRDS